QFGAKSKSVAASANFFVKVEGGLARAGNLDFIFKQPKTLKSHPSDADEKGAAKQLSMLSCAEPSSLIGITDEMRIMLVGDDGKQKSYSLELKRPSADETSFAGVYTVNLKTATGALRVTFDVKLTLGVDPSVPSFAGVDLSKLTDDTD